MSFDEKVRILRTLPQFKVIPISEVRAVAYAAKSEKNEFNIKGSDLYLTTADIEKIVREYPDLEAKLG